MPAAVEVLLVLLFGVLPGASFVWAYERQVGSWGVGLGDRVTRFVGASAAVHAALAPLTYVLWHRSIATERFAAGEVEPILLWIPALVYLGTPAALGAWNGASTSRTGAGLLERISQVRHLGWLRYLAQRSAAPRAWDRLFAREGLEGWVRIRLKDGTWIGGAYATHATRSITSYASGYPGRRDLFLAHIVDVDPETGEFLFVQDDGGRRRLVVRDEGLLIGWSEIAYLTFQYTLRGGE